MDYVPYHIFVDLSNIVLDLHRDGRFDQHLSTTSTNTKSKRKTRGATMLTNVTKAHESDVYFLVNFCPRELVRLTVNMLIVLGVTCQYKVEAKLVF